MSWLTLFEEFQTLIVGLVGFSGVILTLILQDIFSKSSERRSRQHETHALRALLRAHLLGNQSSLISRIEQLEDAKSGKSVEGRMSVSTALGIYQTSWSKLGLLTKDEIEKIGTAFAVVGNIPEHFFVAPDLEFEWSENGNVKISADDPRFPQFWNIHIAAGDIMNEAIDAIDLAAK